MGVKYDKTAEDIRIEQRDLASNRTLKHLRDLHAFKFNVGDLLIREDRRGDKWITYTSPNGLTYRYVYVFENELGVGYVRRLSIEGDRFVEFPICVVNFDPTQTRFHLDPAMADQILLGEEDEEIDLKSDYKELKRKRALMHRANDKIREKTFTEQEVLAFLKRLSVGQKVWMGYTRNGVQKEHYTVSKVHIDTRYPKDSFVELQFPSSWSQRLFVEKVDSIMRRWWFTTRPQFLDELL